MSCSINQSIVKFFRALSTWLFFTFLSINQHLDEVTWTTKNWHGLQMQRLSVVLHTAVAWQTVNELACGDSGIVHGAKCIAVLNGVA